MVVKLMIFVVKIKTGSENHLIAQKKHRPPPFPLTHPMIDSVLCSQLICDVNIIHPVVIQVNEVKMEERDLYLFP